MGIVNSNTSIGNRAIEIANRMEKEEICLLPPLPGISSLPKQVREEIKVGGEKAALRAKFLPCFRGGAEGGGVIKQNGFGCSG